MKILKSMMVLTALLLLIACQNKPVGNGIKAVDNNQVSGEIKETDVENINNDKQPVTEGEDSNDEVTVTQVEEPFSVIVLASSLNVRKDATTESEIVGRVLEWASYEVIETKKDIEDRKWYNVRFANNEVGWLAGWYCSEIYKDSILGGYVTLIEVADFNSKLINYKNEELSKNGIKVKMNDLSAVTTEFSYVQLNNEENKKSLNYELVSTINLPLSDDIGIAHPIFLDEDTLLYIMCVGNDKQYLVKKNVFNDVHEIIYSMSIDGINVNSAQYNLSVLSLTDHHIVYKLDNHVIIYNREDDIVERHYRYEGVGVLDISNDLTKIVVDQEYSDYVTSIDLSETLYVFEWNGEHDLDFLGPTASFSQSDNQLINIGVNGYEWRAGEYVYDMQSGDIYNLGYTSEYSQFSEFQAWEYAVESSNEHRLMGMYDYDLDELKMTAVISDLSTISYLSHYYTFSETVRQYSYDLGQPLYDQEGNLVFFDVVNNIEHRVSGIEDNLDFECGNKTGELLIFTNEEGYYLYKSNHNDELDVSEETSSVVEENKVDLPEVSFEELTAFELYRPTFTIQEAIEEEFNYIESSSGKEYSNEYVTYYFLERIETPYAMGIHNMNPYKGPRGINIGSTLDSILEIIPNKNDWSYDGEQSFIYGSQTNFDEPPKNAVNANFLDNGVGSLTIVTEIGLPYVQFIFEDWKVVNFTYYYEYIN